MKMIWSCLLSLSILLLSVTAQATGTLSVTYYHNDATGSPVAATNQQGQVVWRKVYTPYGEASGRDRDNRIGYTGHVEDANGLIFAGARYYDPMLGRFLSTDPVGFSESNLMSFNRYAYANNNPFKYVDPDGRDPVVGGFSYSSGYLPHYGVDQKTVDRMTTGLAGATVALGLGAGAAILAPAAVEVQLGQLMFANGNLSSGIIAENASLSGNTLVMENFTVAAQDGKGLLSASRGLLDYANKIGANEIRAEGTFTDGTLAARFGQAVGDTFSKTFAATKEGIKEALGAIK